MSQFRSNKMSVESSLDVFIEPFVEKVMEKQKTKEKLSLSRANYDHIQGIKPELIDEGIQINDESIDRKSVSQEKSKPRRADSGGDGIKKS